MLPQHLMSRISTAASALIPNYTTSEAGNPFLSGWYADPDADFFQNQYFVYPTSSLPYDEQLYLDAFSSPDLVHWTKHPSILTTANVSWARRAVWAPCVVHRNDKYYLYFGANDIQEDEDPTQVLGGIGVAVSDHPQGPFVDAIGKPLIGDYHHGAQPIDQDVFVDDDGQSYIYYGGHGHAVVAKLNSDMVSLGTITYPDGTSEVFREITPENYVEGPVVFKRRGKYYMMWSEGGWTGPDYAVAYGVADSPLGPFDRVEKILEQDPAVATGSGHNGLVNVPGTDIWYIVYHRRPLSETDGNHRVVCYDRLYFDGEGKIKPVKMLVRDNFEDGGMIAWKTPVGKFEVRDGAMVSVRGTGGLAEVNGMALLDTSFADHVFEADIKILSDTKGGQGAGLVFRAARDGSTGYFAGISVGSMKASVVKLSEAGGNQAIAVVHAVFVVGRTYRLRVKAVGSAIQVSVDGALLVTASDSTYANGANGVRVHQADASFDNVAIDKA